ncbi:hypothetical protein HD596_010089 [Nonomuraea jabiensis]|uniref:Uncharacterized protein n=1 Tax=Nonomuraea jabiensis TaxID=882448 RepID=A0A7W9GGF8_9ACTN|nr:hypothetical protein [Nonomuraea jabiensis]
MVTAGDVRMHCGRGRAGAGSGLPLSRLIAKLSIPIAPGTADGGLDR